MRLVELIQDVISAEAELAACRAEAVTPAYACYDQQHKADRAADALRDELADFVDSRIEAARARGLS